MIELDPRFALCTVSGRARSPFFWLPPTKTSGGIIAFLAATYTATGALDCDEDNENDEYKRDQGQRRKTIAAYLTDHLFEVRLVGDRRVSGRGEGEWHVQEEGIQQGSRDL